MLRIRQKVGATAKSSSAVVDGNKEEVVVLAERIHVKDKEQSVWVAADPPAYPLAGGHVGSVKSLFGSNAKPHCCGKAENVGTSNSGLVPTDVR